MAFTPRRTPRVATLRCRRFPLSSEVGRFTRVAYSGDFQASVLVARPTHFDVHSGLLREGHRSLPAILCLLSPRRPTPPRRMSFDVREYVSREEQLATFRTLKSRSGNQVRAASLVAACMELLSGSVCVERVAWCAIASMVPSVLLRLIECSSAPHVTPVPVPCRRAHTFEQNRSCAGVL